VLVVVLAVVLRVVAAGTPAFMLATYVVRSRTALTPPLLLTARCFGPV
jgi:hypothetical protein